MASGKEIKQRIKSVKNTKKITKAMELVAASKMKRAVTRTMDARSYAKYSTGVLNALPQETLNTQKNMGDKKLVILISSNRGLCGAYNAQVLRAVVLMLRENPTTQYEFMTVGKKGDFAMRRLNQNVIANFDIGESVSFADALPIADFAMNEFAKANYTSVSVFYTDFVSALTQNATHIQLLPFDIKNTERIDGKSEALKTIEIHFEPSYERVSEAVIKKVIRMQIYHMILESFASEQSSRMVAMKNASEAAGEMIDDLTLAFNKARQASITQEISEISAGMASVS